MSLGAGAELICSVASLDLWRHHGYPQEGQLHETQVWQFYKHMSTQNSFNTNKHSDLILEKLSCQNIFAFLFASLLHLAWLGLQKTAIEKLFFFIL